MTFRPSAKPASFAAGIIALAALGGCVTDIPGGYGYSTRPGGVEGNWSDTSGVATSSFTSGRFVTVANDTGNRLAEGSYRYTSGTGVEINYFSLARQQQIRANCLVVNTSQMNCTNDAGSQFTLVRRGAVG